MLLFRMGPRYLFIRTESIDDTTNFLEEKLNGELIDFKQGFEKSSEDSTLCFITDINLSKTQVEDAKRIVHINAFASDILSSIINNNACNLMHRIDMGPSFIIMRTAGNEGKLLESIKERFSGEEVDLLEGVRIGEKNDSIIAFTNKSIIDPIGFTDFQSKMLLIHKPSAEVREKLRLEGLRLITQSLNDNQWFELRINIYDSKGKYQENYERLMFIMSRLDMGMVLGESWTKDYAVMLYSVMTYQVRLFTFLKPQKIKKILMALEYSFEGKRMVDFDLYYKNKKVYWYDINKPGERKKSKQEESQIYRQDLYKKLKAEDIEILEKMEKLLT